jgi:hypothetical protein
MRPRNWRIASSRHLRKHGRPIARKSFPFPLANTKPLRSQTRAPGARRSEAQHAETFQRSEISSGNRYRAVAGINFRFLSHVALHPTEQAGVARRRKELLDCGGKRSATPLSFDVAERKRCRRCALPPQSKGCAALRAFTNTGGLSRAAGQRRLAARGVPPRNGNDFWQSL